ncbi:zinc finger protein 254 [Folsomia candida]|uniref:zinc finger protein 254 n=1 Tax=Folsomia candida TaxID=158441 RepID=UPI001604C724|nr:zinc finger protein 254 [Folsomia candida]
MSSPVCFLCFQFVDIIPSLDDKETRQIRISTLCEVLLSSTHTRRKVTPQFDEDETCELCPVCGRVISEMEQFRDQMSALEEQIGIKMTKIREIMLASSGENGDDGGDKAHKLRRSILKMMGDNDDQQDENFALDEVQIKVEQDDGDVFLGGDDGSFDDHNSPYAVSELNMVPVGDDDYDELAFCISPHPQKRRGGRPKSTGKNNRKRTKRKIGNDSPPIFENQTSKEAVRRSTRPKKTVLPPKGFNKTLTVSLERISVPPVAKSSPISSTSLSPFNDDDTQQDYLPFDDLDLSKEHQKTKPTHTCPSCPRSFTTSSILSNHIARQHCIPCPDPHCHAAFSTTKGRDAHRKVAHPQGVEGRKSKAQSIQLAERVIDFYKNEANQDSKKTVTFFRQQGVPRSTVFRYLKRFKDEGIVQFKKLPGRIPRSELDSIVRPFKCSSCSKSFTRRETLSEHIARDHTRVKEHVCEICGKNFYTILSLRKHLRGHDESIRSRCETCGEDFLYASSLQTHQVREHGADRVVCDECGATFTSTKGLWEHKRTHTGIKAYKCDQCDAAFSQRQQLRNHLLSHSDQRPYPCPHCERAFKTGTKLRAHIMRIHTPGYVTPTPCKCSQCGKGFQYPYLLKAHVLQAHTGERPFTCSQCGKGFVTKSALTLHLQRTHGIGEAVVKNRQPRSKRDTFHVEGDP